MDKRRIIIDTDPGIDDAAAITLAIISEKFDIRLISATAANVDVDKTTKNALKLVEFFGADIPVARGCERPLLHELASSPDIHGESGMDGYDFPEPQKKPLPVHSVEAMRRVIMEEEGRTTLVAIAALTNVALLFAMYPEVKERIDEIVMMGGGIYRGNATSAAEFNIYIDPHAAAMVFRSGVPIRMAGLDVTERALLHKDRLAEMRDSGRAGHMLYSLLTHYRDGDVDAGLAMHDPCTIALMLESDMFRMEDHYVEVVTEGIAAGALVTNLERKMKICCAPNVSVCMDIDEKRFEDWFVEMIRR